MGLNLQFMVEAFLEIIRKLPVNLQLTFIPFPIGLGIAVIITILRETKVKWLIPAIRFYISFIRGTPVILQIYLVFYALPELIRWIVEQFGGQFDVNNLSVTTLCIIALTINISAYLSETIRSGVGAVQKGEIEAGYSTGMTRIQVLRRIVLPQALQISLPNFCTLIIAALQNSVIVFYVTLEEMNATASIVAQDNWLYFESYLVVGLIFWVITIVIEVVFHILEKRSAVMSHLHG